MSSFSTYSLPVPFEHAPINIVARRTSWGVLVLLFAAYGLVPWIADDYWLNAILIPFLVLSLAAIGLNILMGYAGQASVGSAGFMAVGAFAAYNLLLRVPALPLPLALIAGGFIAAGVGFIFGIPSARIKGFYLMVTTLAAQFFMEWVFVKFPWFYNHASSGTISAPRLAIFGYDISSPTGRYLLTLVTITLLTWIAINIVCSQIGRNWMAIRDMDTAASVIGIPVGRYKRLAFAVSSFYLGIAGALWVFAYLGTASAASFDINRSFQILFIIIIGGMGSIAGNFAGAAFISLLPIFLSHAGQFVLGGNVDAAQIQNLQKIIFGALIIFFLIREPEGLIKLLSNLRARLAVWPLRF
ncbi:MAG: branched-chain amino acid ABC transporter permease [Azoarcus sp.]|jgi:branched-chain amino acid transport system permease protein|nr:branched-chain amino acid ABC transporter permease [Azoarcus sp.]